LNNSTIPEPILFSVVIPLYNKRDQIFRAVNSVLIQTYQNFELIVVDDGSKDHSSEIVAGLKDLRLKLIRQENKGEGAARNRGIREADHEFIAFLDADDEWKPNFLESVLSLIREYPEAVLYGTGCERYINESHTTWPTEDCFPRGWSGIIDDYIKIIAHRPSPFNSSSTITTKTVLQEIGGFPEGVSNGPDMAAWIRCSLLGDIAYLHLPLSIYYTGIPGSASSEFDWCNEYYPSKVLQELLKNNKVPKGSKAYAHYYISKFSLMTAKARFQVGQPFQALGLLWKCRFSTSTFRRVYNLIKDEFVPSLKRKNWSKIGNK